MFVCPECAHCGVARQLIEAVPDVPKYELRKYHCPQCGDVVVVAVKSDEPIFLP
jgi:transcription elongation factor Elf1